MTGFSDLPVELYDELTAADAMLKILSHVAPIEFELSGEQRRGPSDVLPNHLYPLWTIHSSRSKLKRMWDKSCLLPLRLLNRTFNQAILRIYFKTEGVFLFACEQKSVSGFEKHILGAGDGAGAGWDVATHAGRFIIELSEYDHYGRGSIFNEESENEHYKIDAVRRADLNSKAARLASVIERNWLTKTLAKMTRLEEIAVELNEQWRCRGSAGDLDIGFDSDDDHDQDLADIKVGTRLRLELLERVRVGVASIFQSPAHLTSLQSLRLVLPSAYDIAFVAAHIPDTVADRLNHLHLEYIDGTGPEGDLYYTVTWSAEGDYLYSSLQFKNRNTAYASAMCALVNRCHNLESLGLAGTQCIDLEGLDWRRHPGKLKNINVSRALMTQKSMRKLFGAEPSGEGPCRLAAVVLLDVQLWDGSWEAVFSYLRSSTELLYVNVYNLVYDKDGESDDLALHNNRPWENESEIWTEHEPDRQTLRHLVRETEARGGVVGQEIAEMADDMDEENKEEEEEELEEQGESVWSKDYVPTIFLGCQNSF